MQGLSSWEKGTCTEGQMWVLPVLYTGHPRFDSPVLSVRDGLSEEKPRCAFAAGLGALCYEELHGCQLPEQLWGIRGPVGSGPRSPEDFEASWNLLDSMLAFLLRWTLRRVVWILLEPLGRGVGVGARLRVSPRPLRAPALFRPAVLSAFPLPPPGFLLRLIPMRT